MAKLWQTEMVGEVVDDVPADVRRLRLHARVPVDAGVHGRARRAHLRGTNEIMKIIIAKQMGL